MKIIFQTLVILVVATLIGGAIFAAVNGTSSSAQATSIERSNDDDDGDRPPHPEGEEGGIELPFGVVKSLVIISIIGVPYFYWSKWYAKKSKAAMA